MAQSTLASHQCGLGLIPGINTISGLSLLLVLSLDPRGFSPVTPSFLLTLKATLLNSNLIWGMDTFQQNHKNFLEVLRGPGKQITIYNNYYIFGGTNLGQTSAHGLNS